MDPAHKFYTLRCQLTDSETQKEVAFSEFMVNETASDEDWQAMLDAAQQELLGQLYPEAAGFTYGD